MSPRTLGAVLACRADSSRLYAKPLQNLAPGINVLDQKLNTLAAMAPTVSRSVIAISEGIDNLAYIEYANRRNLPYVIGSKRNILSRLVAGAVRIGASDVLRLTSENPFIWWERLEEAWLRHLEEGNDLTVTDGCPYGSYFEIIRLEALQIALEHATAYQCEACTQYFRDHGDRFRIRVITPPGDSYRLDVRLSIDNPEDLYVARRIYQRFSAQAPLIPLDAIIAYWDEQPLFRELLAPSISGKGIWVKNEGCPWAPAAK
jgi:spore coat polysaccharide biosynthesis protein SpsF